MTSHELFPSLEGWEPTRDTLHWYTQAVGVVPRAHALAHPKWWHISLKVQPDGLVTDNMALPGGGSFFLKMDLRQHRVSLVTSRGEVRQFSMLVGLSATEFGDQILEAVADLGLEGEYARQKFENEDPRQYDQIYAERYFTALVNADLVFKKHRAGLDGEVGPVQLWPHGFDLAFELYGTRQVEYQEEGEVSVYPSQLNLGFSPGESSHPQPYFYSNPFPFEKEELLEHTLPNGARWFTESWQGSILPYQELSGYDRAEARLLAYARRVHEICAPLLEA
ncbi:MAG: DUF5996 family protein [Anaerolineales bacterium]